MDGNLFISPDAEGSDSVSSFGEHRGLAGELLQQLGCPGQPVSALPDADVEAELADAQFPHGVLLLTLILRHDGKQEELCLVFVLKSSLSAMAGAEEAVPTHSYLGYKAKPVY